MVKDLEPVFYFILGLLCYYTAQVTVPASVLFHSQPTRATGELSDDLKDRISVKPCTLPPDF